MKNAIGSQCPTINIRQYQTASYINQICFCSCLFSVLDGLDIWSWFQQPFYLEFYFEFILEKCKIIQSSNGVPESFQTRARRGELKIDSFFAFCWLLSPISFLLGHRFFPPKLSSSPCWVPWLLAFLQGLSQLLPALFPSLVSFFPKS